MLLKQFSELRLTDPISIVLSLIVLGAFIGGVMMYRKDKKAAKQAALNDALKHYPEGVIISNVKGKIRFIDLKNVRKASQKLP